MSKNEADTTAERMFGAWRVALLPALPCRVNELRLPAEVTGPSDQQRSYEISATVVDSRMLEWWLRTYGDVVWEVKRSPASMKP
jgi:hypothetical protein